MSLDALLTERSVTRAAERLHLSQPALSASLARLRTHFDDPILARRGNSYELTPLAIRLTDHTTTALEAARRVFESQAAWNPELSTREFAIYGSDYSFATVGRHVSRLARQQAPGVRFRFMLHSPAVVEDATSRLRSADAMLIPHGFLSDLPYADLWQDRWVGVTSTHDTTIGERATMADLSARPWVFTYQSREAFTSASRQIQQLGIERDSRRSLRVSSPWRISSKTPIDSAWCTPRSHPLSSVPRACVPSLCPSMRPRCSTPCGGILCTIATPSTSGCAGCSCRPRPSSETRTSLHDHV